MPVAVELRDVAFAYPGGREVLHDVTLGVERGEFVAIAGPNGGGKTTLLRVALGLERPSRGEALLFGEPASRFSRHGRIGYLSQRAELGIDAPISVREIVSTGCVPRRGLFGPLRAADRALVDEAIERVGLSEQADAVVTRLSGGQQQRAFIAKALAARPDLLVLDEPTAGVDVGAQEALAALLEDLRRELGVTILFASHEFGAVEQFVDRLVLVRGQIVFDGPPTALPTTWHDPSHAHA
jgi:zinc transport system ATP-binding protein